MRDDWDIPAKWWRAPFARLTTVPSTDAMRWAIVAMGGSVALLAALEIIRDVAASVRWLLSWF